MRILLVQPPFFSIERPSAGLSLLRAVLRGAGFRCDIDYLNLRFAREIGLETYLGVSENVPAQLLLADLIFSEALFGAPLDIEEVRSSVSAGTAHLDSPLSVPRWYYERFSELSAGAVACVDGAAADWGSRYDLVGVSAIFQLLPALAVARAVKANNAKTRVIIGGSHCEAEMGLAIHECMPFVDFVARGESERLLVALARAVSTGRPRLEQIPGLVWRSESGASIANGARGAATDLNELPFPDYDDWIAQAELAGYGDRDRWMIPIETSRGCWYGEKNHCTFCGLNGEDIGYRRKTPERALREFTHVAGLGVRSIHATDNILDHRYFDTLLPALEKADLGINVFYEVKANLQEADIRRLAAAGVTRVQPGIESLSTPLLKLMRKGVFAWQNVRLLRLALQYDVTLIWNLLYGFPGDAASWYAEMTDLFPLVAHLPPPLYSASRVRADRFSPLFEDGATMGVSALRPFATYSLALPFDEGHIERIAYYFDFESGQPSPVAEYLPTLRDSVMAWVRSAGDVAFTSLRRDGAIVLSDDRAVAKLERAELRGADAAVYSAAESGCSRRDLVSRCTVTELEMERSLARLTEHHWLVELDGRYLALGVPMDHVVPDLESTSVATAVAQALCKDRITASRSSLATTDAGVQTDRPRP